MKERPILFSAPMVRALLDGSKTQTRRVVKPQGNPEFIRVNGDRTSGWNGNSGDPLKCPYGQPGDRLWVRETWYCDDYRVQSGPYLEVDGARDLLAYRADGDHPYEAEQPVWRPSIHMPRWASRILLEIVSVRVERLKDISEADAMAEGAAPVLVPPDGGSCPHVEGYRDIWESINGAGSWDANPWVWVVEFKRVQL